MTLRFIDSFDHYDTTHMNNKWINRMSYHTIVSAGRHSSDCLRTDGNHSPLGVSRVPLTDAQTIWIVGFALKFNNFTNSAATDRIAYFPRFRSASGTEMLLQREPSTSPTSLQIRRGDYNNTILATGSKIIELDQWYFIEIKYYANNSVGTVDVRVNNITDISFGPGDTVLSSDQINEIDFGGSKYAGDFYIDDLYICDGSGTYNNGFLGDIRVDSLFPSGTGTASEWSFTGSASNYECVDESPPNDDTDYVYESNVSEYDTYNFDDSPITEGSILGIQQNILSRKSDAGSRSIASIIISGGNNYTGTSQSLGDSYSYYLDIYETDPDTASPWSITGVNNAEFGQILES